MGVSREPAAAQVSDFEAAVMTELERSHASLVEVLTESTALSEGAVLVIGEQLDVIVEQARVHSDQTTALLSSLRGDAGGSLVDRVRHHREVVRQFEVEFTQLTTAQAALADEALEHCLKLQLVSRSISEIAMAGTILVLQVRIEAAQLEGSDIDLSSIAESLSLLNDQVSHVSDRVDNVVHTLRRTLPAIIEQTRQLKQLARRSTAELDRQGRAVELGSSELEVRLTGALRNAGDELAGILERSQRALSIFQFQDPMVQELQRVDGVLADARSACALVLGRDERFSPLRYSTNLGELGDPVAADDAPPGPESGELLLF